MELCEIHIGDRLKWTDPEYPDDTPRPVTVVGKNGDIISCTFDFIDGYGEVEAYAHELSK